MNSTPSNICVHDIIPKYRMVKAYDFFYSYQNEVPQETFEKRKKRKMKGVLFWDFSGKLRTNIYLCNEV
jgi:hypothetical protein